MTIKLKIKRKLTQSDCGEELKTKAPNTSDFSAKAKVTKIASPTELPKTLAQLKDRLLEVPGLPAKQLRDLRSAVSGVGKAARLPLSQIPTDVCRLREILARAHPAQLNISRKRFSNIKSGLENAMIEAGLLPGKQQRAHSDAWVEFLKISTVDHQRWGVSRFATYCSEREIGPQDVSNHTLDEYQTHLALVSLQCDPAKATKDAGTNFNAIVRRAKLAWPLLNLCRNDKFRSRPLETYPQSLRSDLDCYLDRLSSTIDLDDDSDGPDEPLKATSLRNIRAHVRQLADAAVSAGYEPCEFKTLADLIRIPVLSASIKAIVARTGREASGTLLNILSTALNIGVHYVKLPPNQLALIKKKKAFVAKRSGYNNPHLTERNQRRLAQFADPANFKALVMLPERLMAVANREAGSPRAALDALAATAIAILLCCPMRAKNLASLDIKRHFIRRLNGKQILYRVHVSKDETKNRQDIDFDLSASVSDLITNYLEHHQPVIATDTSYVFPRGDGRHRDPGKLGELVEERIRKWLGLEVNMHLFRHLLAMKYLEAYPGEYESVRRMLCHAKIDTTTGYYAPLSNKAIQQKYHDGVLAEPLKPAAIKAKGKMI